LASTRVWLFGWSVFAGFVMSMGVGGGGILAGVGHISILGIGDPNMIKVVNQILGVRQPDRVGAAVSQQRRLVWSVAFAYGIGRPIGASMGAWFSKERDGKHGCVSLGLRSS
jgi:uncharacterized membrane protein YfcA